MHAHAGPAHLNHHAHRGLLDHAREGGQDAAEELVRRIRLCIRNTRHGGRLLVTGYAPPLPPGQFDDLMARAVELESRMGIRIARPGLPSDFPTVLGSPGAEYLSAVVLELS